MTKYKLEINKTDYDYHTFEADSYAEAYTEANKWLEAYNENMVAEDDYSKWDISSLETYGDDDDNDE